MKWVLKYSVFSITLMLGFFATAKTIVVNTTNNVNPGVNETNLVSAINLLQDGDTIQFNIPGAGPHYLVSPTGGYPIITNKHNITIDGYSQPGSSPNTNPILASNNAVIKIVLDARNGNFTTLSQDIPGYGTDEVAILFVLGCTNFSVRGICFLGTWDYNSQPFDSYALAFGGDQGSHNAHVSGCRFGLDVDNTTVARLKDGITAFGSGPTDGIIVGVAAGATNSAQARAQFNIFIAEQIPIIIEGNSTRISGNFFNVMPDGLHDFLIDGTVSGPDHTLEAYIEIGSYGNNVVIGTDGDGVTDADERNVFGGVIAADDDRILEWYGGQRTNTVVAGNYIGVGVDGTTVFTNGGPNMEVIGGFNSTTTVQLGSDFDGVSDDIEGNVIFWNHPFDILYPDPVFGTYPNGWRFADISVGARVSFRGNKLVNNDICPFTWANGHFSAVNNFTNFSSRYMEITNGIIPGLDTNSAYPHLKGTFAVGLAPYTNIIIDVYELDEEGWNNGKLFALAELSDVFTYSNGFPQGKRYIGSFTTANTGSFDLNLAGRDLGSGSLTVTANYSADPPGTHHGNVQTSNFANPIKLEAPPLVQILRSGANVQLSWPTNSGMFSIQGTTSLSTPSWTDLSPQPPITQAGAQYQALVPLSGTQGFLRLHR
jgi:hypothetical protein